MPSTFAFAASRHQPRYRPIGNSNKLMNKPNYFILQSSLSTLTQLRDSTDNQSQYVAYTRAIDKLREQIAAL